MDTSYLHHSDFSVQPLLSVTASRCKMIIEHSEHDIKHDMIQDSSNFTIAVDNFRWTTRVISSINMDIQLRNNVKTVSLNRM